MGIVLGLAAALLYGSSDFAGGAAARRFGELRVTLVGSVVATAGIWAVLLVVGGPGPSARAVGWGLAAGVAGDIGTLVLYRGLARGQMSVVGPVSAVGAAVVPVIVGVALGEHPGMLGLAGVLISLPAIALVAGSGSIRGKLGAGLGEGLVAGVLFGILFIGLAQAGKGSGLWPVAFEQSSTLVVTLAIALKSRQPLRIPVREAGLTAFAGASGLAAAVSYFYATHFSMLAVAAVLVSLYPVVTVLLARVLLHERLAPPSGPASACAPSPSSPSP